MDVLLGMQNGAPVRSAREADVRFDRFEAEFERAVARELRAHTARVERNERVRMEQQEAAQKVAARKPGGDNLKIGAADGFAHELVTGPAGDVRPAQRAYRPVAAHNTVIEWVRQEVEQRCAAEPYAPFGLAVRQSDATRALGSGELGDECYIDTVVRAAYFTAIALDAPEFFVVAGNPAERNAILNTLRDVRQVTEAEGHDWFI